MSRSAKRGYTLIELLLAMASASALMVGLSGSLLIASYALDIDKGASAARNSADSAMARLTADTRHALKYTERSLTAIEFTVPDRDGDNVPETLRYAWGGTAGAPLVRSRNGGSSFPVLRNVDAFSLAYAERLVPAVDVTIEPAPKWPVVESFSLEQLITPATSATVSLPTGVAEGELLIAAIVIQGNEVSSLVPPAGWILLDASQRANKVTLSVWWKIATAGEPADYQWQWGNNRYALGWILRISNQAAGTPITTFRVRGGNEESPSCPSRTSLLDHSLVLRFGGFEGDDIVVDSPGLAAHTPLLMEASEEEVSGGCGYKVLRANGASGETDFSLTKKRRFRSLTMIVAPAQDF